MTLLEQYSPDVIDELLPFLDEADLRLVTAAVEQENLEASYEDWLHAMFPSYVTAPLAEHHHDLWRWVWNITPEVRPDAEICIWNRGGAKSTSAEMAAVALGARGVRKYGWYICGTQDQADDHVGNIGSMLESSTVAALYPTLSDKLLGKFGNAKGWRRNRLRCASGFTIDAMGLDSAARGGKLEEQRPDFIIIDDIDDEKDSPKITRKKITTLTKGLIPAGAENLAVLAIQNLIHPNSVFAKLATNKADFLRRRHVSGPIPALRGFAYRQHEDGTYSITSGEPTWEGFGVARCEGLLNDIGPKAFRTECQHDVDRVEGAKWTQDQIDAMRVATHPDLVRVVVAVDPSGGDEEGNDEQGIVVAGRGVDGKAYVLGDYSCKLKPHGWASRAVGAYEVHNADRIVGEPNFGGQMVEYTIKSVRDVPYKDVHASRGKAVRAEPVAARYGDPDRPDEWDMSEVRHVGVFPELEEEMRTWTEDSGWSPNRLDALVWALTELLLGKSAPRAVFRG